MDIFPLTDDTASPPVVLRLNPSTGRYQVFARTTPPKTFVNRLLAEQELEMRFALNDDLEAHKLVPLAKNVETLRKLMESLPNDQSNAYFNPMTGLPLMPALGAKRTRVQVMDDSETYLGMNCPPMPEIEPQPIVKKRKRKRTNEAFKVAKLRRSIVRLFLQHIRNQFEEFKPRKAPRRSQSLAEDRSSHEKTVSFGNECTAEPPESRPEESQLLPETRHDTMKLKPLRKLFLFLSRRYKVPKQIIIRYKHLYRLLFGQLPATRNARSKEAARILTDVLEARSSPKATRNLFKQQPLIALWQNSWGGPAEAFQRSFRLKKLMSNADQTIVLLFFRQLLEQCHLPYSEILA